MLAVCCRGVLPPIIVIDEPPPIAAPLGILVGVPARFVGFGFVCNSPACFVLFCFVFCFFQVDQIEKLVLSKHESMSEFG